MYVGIAIQRASRKTHRRFASPFDLRVLRPYLATTELELDQSREYLSLPYYRNVGINPRLLRSPAVQYSAVFIRDKQPRLISNHHVPYAPSSPSYNRERVHLYVVTPHLQECYRKALIIIRICLRLREYCLTCVRLTSGRTLFMRYFGWQRDSRNYRPNHSVIIAIP